MKSQLKLYYLAYKTPFSWKQMVSMAVYPLQTVMSSHVRTMFATSLGMASAAQTLKDFGTPKLDVTPILKPGCSQTTSPI
jgi:hypothetical protein